MDCGRRSVVEECFWVLFYAGPTRAHAGLSTPARDMSDVGSLSGARTR